MRVPSRARRLFRLAVVVVSLQAGLWLAHSSPAAAATHLSGVHYTTNTEWTTAGSPYVLDGDVHVDSGTLTIDPGVVVKLNGQTTTLWVSGRLSAEGTATDPITFTSYQDDSVGGDTNGDGTATHPAPGQWYSIMFMSGSTGSFDYANISYGGYGSVSYAYGAIHLQGSTTSVIVDHSKLENNQCSGIEIAGGYATVSHTEIDHNGGGAAVDTSVLTINKNSNIHDNTNNGVFMNMAGWTGSASTVNNSTVANNGTNGIKLQVDAWTPDASTPTGTQNNIYGNGGKQLWALRSMPNTDWTDNYWGTGSYLGLSWQMEYMVCPGGSPTCVPPAGYFNFHLKSDGPWDWNYIPYPSDVPEGPVSWTYYSWVYGNKVYQTGLDYVEDYPYSTTQYDNSGL